MLWRSHRHHHGFLAARYAAIRSLATLQHRQRSNTGGKNATDTALVIDAMDPMHGGTLPKPLISSKSRTASVSAQSTGGRPLRAVGGSGCVPGVTTCAGPRPELPGGAEEGEACAGLRLLPSRVREHRMEVAAGLHEAVRQRNQQTAIDMPFDR